MASFHFSPVSPWIPGAFALASGLLLAAAYSLEYGFGYAPCQLCLWERVPYAVALVAGVLGYAAKHPYRGRAALAVIILSFSALTLLAWYHVGVERGLFQGSTGCTGSLGDTNSLDAMRDAIMEAPLVSCAQPTAVFFGLSLAEWNALFASGLLLSSLFFFFRKYP